MSDKIFKTPVTSENSFAQKLACIHNGKIWAKFKGNCLIQDNVFFAHRNVVHLFIVYELDTSPRDLSTNFTLGDCLFGAFKLTKNPDPDKYRYNGYGIGFDARSQFLLSNSEWGKNDVIFGVDNSSSVHDDNRKKDILVFCEGPTNGFDDAAITAEAKYAINMTKSRKKVF